MFSTKAPLHRLLLLSLTCCGVDSSFGSIKAYHSAGCSKLYTSPDKYELHPRIEKYGCGSTEFQFNNNSVQDNAFSCPTIKRYDIRSENWLGGNEAAQPEARFFSDGYNARPGEFPSYAQLTFWHTTEHLETQTCGGTLLDRSLVITAGRCLNASRFNAISISLGVVDGSDISHEQVVHSKSVCLMPGFSYSDEDGPMNDVLLIETREAVEFNRFVAPACLSTIRETQPTAQCYSVGRGIRTNGGVHSDKLIALPMKKQCRAMPDYVGLEGRACWQTNSKIYRGNPCPDDYGAPMYCLDRCDGITRQYVVGAVSFGYDDSCIKGMSYYYVYSDYYKLRVELRDMFKRCFRKKPSPFM